jgi:hypothetical protein
MQSTNSETTPPTHPQTGPTSAAGKSRSSDNATTHGGTSQKLIVAGEQQQDFTNLLSGLLAEYSPETPSARLLIEDFAHAQWFLWRRIRAQNSVEHALYESQPDPALWTGAAFHTLTNMERYRTTAERAFQRALRNLEHLRYAQLTQSNRDVRQQNFETRLTLDRERVTLQQDRHLLSVARDNREVEAEQALAAEQIARQDQAEYNEVSRGFNVPTIIQNIRVRKTPEGTVTKFNPSNKEVRACLQSDEYKFPFESVFRRLIFENGIPEEYWWDEESERRAGTRNARVTQTLTRATWLKMADQEKQNADGHAVSGHEFLYDEEED